MRRYKSELANTMVEGNYFRFYSVPNCFLCGSAGKESTGNEGDLGSIPGLGDPLEKEKATHSSILAWRIPQTVQSMGLQRVRHD